MASAIFIVWLRQKNSLFGSVQWRETTHSYAFTQIEEHTYGITGTYM